MAVTETAGQLLLKQSFTHRAHGAVGQENQPTLPPETTAIAMEMAVTMARHWNPEGLPPDPRRLLLCPLVLPLVVSSGRVSRHPITRLAHSYLLDQIIDYSFSTASWA